MVKLNQRFHSPGMSGGSAGSNPLSVHSPKTGRMPGELERALTHLKDFFLPRAGAYTPHDISHLAMVMVQCVTFDAGDVLQFAEAASRYHCVDPRESHDLISNYEKFANDPQFYNKILVCGIYSQALAELEKK